MEKTKAENPANLRIPLDQTKMLMQAGKLEDALNVLQALPAEARDDSDISIMEAHLQFLIAANTAPGIDELSAQLEKEPDNLDRRFRLASRYVTADQFEPALEQLLTIVQKNSPYKNDLARKAMLAIIQLIGDGHEVSEKYRELLRKALH